MHAEVSLIRAIVETYFLGLHQGDAVMLQDLFHPDCVLKAPHQRRSMATWLQDVRQRVVPADIDHPWEYRIIWLEIMSEQAMVKLNCPLPHGHFTDYLGLLKEKNQWKIVNKMYAETRENYRASGVWSDSEWSLNLKS